MLVYWQMVHSKLNGSRQQLVSLNFHLGNETTSHDLDNCKKSRNGLNKAHEMARLISFPGSGKYVFDQNETRIFRWRAGFAAHAKAMVDCRD
jgi:hypothetical protein